MGYDEIAKQVVAEIAVTQEDIARAKAYILRSSETNVDQMVSAWLQDQKVEVPTFFNRFTTNQGDLIAAAARGYSLRMAMYHATWELVTAGEIVSASGATEWELRLQHQDPHGAGEIPAPRVVCPYPPKIYRLPSLMQVSADPDIFLQGADCKSLHPGIREAIEQSLHCFRRGLHMPATAMLAAAAEATWTEYGLAVAKKFGLGKLVTDIEDPQFSFRRKVIAIRGALEKNGKSVIEDAKQHISRVTDAELWTTTLREKRNALHWNKAKSFIADQSETANLLLAAPVHLGALEAIRTACLL